MPAHPPTDAGERIRMVRADLDGIAEFILSEPFSLRRYRPGDETEWVRIHRLADRYNDHDLTRFRNEFGTDSDKLAERQYYLCDGEGRSVGTATAWRGAEDVDADAGRVHWVAIVPEVQGRGLSKPLVATVLRRLGELGHPRAYLDTQSRRVAAVGLYLKLGFVPDVRNDDELVAWRRLREHLPDSPLAEIDLGA